MSRENFQKNYNQKNLRQDFEQLTGLKVSDNPAAYIAYLNNLSLDLIHRRLDNIEYKVKDIKDGKQY